MPPRPKKKKNIDIFSFIFFMIYLFIWRVAYHQHTHHHLETIRQDCRLDCNEIIIKKLEILFSYLFLLLFLKFE